MAKRKRTPTPRYISWNHLAPPCAQQIKKVWGLGANKHCIDLTLVGDNPLLMDMDAPDALPAGSTVREERVYPDAIYFAAKSRIALR